MKINKTLIILSLLLIFCISLGAVSATNGTDMEDKIDINDNRVTVVESSGNLVEINTVNAGETGNFTSLNETIQNSENNIIYLNQDYKFDNESDNGLKNGILISKNNSIIDGQNHTIDGSTLARAFRVTAKNVTIINLNFVNCFNSEYGGTICFETNGFGSVSGCSFVDCRVISNGGASVYGGAIVCGKNCSVSGCSFVGCNVTGNGVGAFGGAIYLNDANGSVIDCSFVGCNVTGNGVGAGGVIFVNGVNGHISNCSFFNINTKGIGGVIYLSDNNESVIDCSFVNVYSSNEGGAIFVNGVNGYISNCSFFNINTKGKGGAIYLNATPEFVIDCSFVNCSSNSSWGGGAIFCAKSNSVINCTFINTYSSNSGGAIFYYDNNNYVINCTFISSSSRNWAGAIQAEKDYLSVINSTFINCSAQYDDAGAINTVGNHSHIENCSFINCSSTRRGGAIEICSGSVINCSFINCSSTERGGAIFWFYSGGSVKNCIFSSCSSLEGNAIWSDVDDLVCDGNFFTTNNTISKEEFINQKLIGKINKYVAPKNWVVLNISNFSGYYVVNFVLNDGSSLNKSMHDYGAVLSENGDLKNIVVKDNVWVGPIYKSGDVTANINNPVNGELLASLELEVPEDSFTALNELINSSEDNLIVLNRDYKFYEEWDGKFISGIIIGDNITIDGNGYSIDGFNIARAFQGTEGNVIIKNITFVNCFATDNGGAIYWDYSFNSSVINCSFVNCSASDDGGAIYWTSCVNCSVGGCSFVNVSDGIDGGAIYWTYSDNISLMDCNFTNCSAGVDAIVKLIHSNNGSIINCSFVNSSTINTYSHGGAISWVYSGNCSVVNCSFVNCNNVGRSTCGGAIYFYEYVGVVSGCSFTNCNAGSGGAIYFNGKGSVNYCIFDNNKAVYDGDAIYIYDSSVDVNYNFFAFQNNVTKFPIDLIYGATSNNWVVLNIVKSSDEYIVKFVFNNGSELNESMPDYTANLTINANSVDICIKNNTFNGTLVDGTYLLTSLNTEEVLAEVSLARFNITYNITTISYDGEGIVLIDFPTDVTGNVTIKVDNQEITRSIQNGSVIFIIKGLSAGTHVLNISYSGDENYLPFNTTANVTVSNSSKLEPNISVDSVVITKGSSVNFVAHLDSDATGFVIFYVNDTKVGVSEIENGIANFTYVPNNVGNFTIKAVYTGDDKYLSSSATGDLTVKEISKLGTTLNASTLTVTAYTSKNLVVTLKDSNGKVLSGKKLIIMFNGKNYTVTTNASGQAKLSITSKVVKNYTATIKFAGDDNYLASSKSVKVVIKPAYVTVADIIKSAKTLKSYSVKNKKLPSTIKVGSYKLTHGQLTYLMTVAIKKIKAGKKTSTKVKVINVKYTAYNAKISKKIMKKGYLSVVNTLYSKGVKGTLPKYFTYGGKKIGYNPYAYSLAKILAFYSSKHRLPTYCVFVNY